MKYVKPDFEEIDLILEGSFLQDSTSVDKVTEEEKGGGSSSEDEADDIWG